MITLLASRNNSAVSAAKIGLTSPWGSALAPSAGLGAAAVVPKPPAITLMKLRFMALHMMYDKMAPLEPTKAPTTINKSLFNMKPVAAAAQPE